jgi:hemerythrin-like domain-containing protein
MTDVPGTASPAQILAEEHVLILRALDALEIRLRALAAGAPIDRDYLERMIEFLRAFADQCHHGKEEGLLFPVMVDQLDFPARSGPIAVLSKDHETGRALVKAIADAVVRVESDPAAARSLIENGQAYIALLQAHIDREDNKVFPAVEDMLDPEEAARLSSQFAQFDAETAKERNAAWAASVLSRLEA